MSEPLVIVGTGIAGATAALTLRSEGFDGRIVMIGDDPSAPYRRPPLSKEVLRGGQAPSRTLLKPVGHWADHGIELLTDATVTELDPAARKITLTGGVRITYHQLLLATGGRPRRLPQTSGLRAVHHLRTLADAQALRGALLRGGHVLVVGAGLIGLEVAAAARLLDCGVTVVERGPEPLGQALPPTIARAVADHHRGYGVDIRTGVQLDRFQHDGDSVLATGRSTTRVTAQTVVVAVGMRPETTLAEQAGLAVDDGIIVDEYCATSAPGIFAAGDVARRPDPLLGGSCRIEHWTHAQEHGAAAARNMLGITTRFAPVPWYWTHQYNTNLQICGFPQEADSITLNGNLAALDFSALLHRQGKLIGVVCANRPGDFRRLRQLVTTPALPVSEPLRDFDGEPIPVG